MLMEIAGISWLSDSVGRMWEAWGVPGQAGLGAWDGWKYKRNRKRSVKRSDVGE